MKQKNWDIQLDKVAKCFTDNSFQTESLFCRQSNVFVTNGTQAEQHFCPLMVYQCKAFFCWLLIDQFNINV